MKYVLDASVAVKCVLPEKDSPRAVRLLNDYRKAIHELIAPDTFPVEVAHALTVPSARKSSSLHREPNALPLSCAFDPCFSRICLCWRARLRCHRVCASAFTIACMSLSPNKKTVSW